MEQMETIKELINQGDVNKAIEALDTLLTQSDFAGKDEVYYLRGNAYRKQGSGSKPSTIINPLLRSTRKARLCKPAKW